MPRAPRSKPSNPSAALERALRTTIRRTLALRLDLDALKQEHDRLAAALGADRAQAVFREACAIFQRATGTCSVCGSAVDDHECLS